MAIEFARIRYVKRSDGGNACRSAAYNARADIRCERTGERFFFAHRDPVLHHEVLLPEGADGRFADPPALWNAAQAAERRKDSQEARELLLALPCNPEISPDDWRVMAAEFAREHFVSKGVAVQLDIHSPHDGDRNIHAHLLVTTRRVEGAGLSAAKARDLDPEVRTLKNGRAAVTEAERWGVLWRDYQNSYFERQGLDIRVDEIGIVAQRHEGPVRMRTVPKAADERAAKTRAENEAAARDPAQLLAALTRHRATFTELDIERLIKKHVPDIAERAVIRAAVLAEPDVVPLHSRESGRFVGRYTTAEVRAEEQRVMAAAEAIKQPHREVAVRYRQEVEEARTLDGEQQAAFARATGTDGLVVVEGLAGSGKSHVVNAIREAHERSGWRVVGLAPTNTVADDLRRAGFSHGSTVHLELYYQEIGREDRAPAWDRRTLVMVDEAAMMDTRTYARLMERAAEARAKVILVGDDRQLSSVERGGMFSEIKARHGSAVISKVRRQEQDWQREASEAFSEGRVGEGLRAYAEHGHVHWSGDLDESRDRLLSDWDQDSRERPDGARFVYASTNREVNRLNRAIRDIRLRRGEVEAGVEVETVRGRFEIGVGDRIQFHGNDRRAGIYNSALGTVTDIRGSAFTVETDGGREVRFDSDSFHEFGLGYAGTVYRGQGKTQLQVYALYDNAFAWHARTAYVGLTRHKAEVDLYVSTDLAASEQVLAAQMSRSSDDEASLSYATGAEVIDLDKAREGRGDQGRGGGGQGDGQGDAGGGAPPAGRLPREEADRLRRLDLTEYARAAHGYTVTPDAKDPARYILSRERPESGADRLEARRAGDGRWMWRNPSNARQRGDILDFARREGAADLAAARAAVAAYEERSSEMAKEPENRKQRAEAELLPEIAADDPARAAKLADATDERRRKIVGAEEEDRRDAIVADEEKRLEAVREAQEAEAARIGRMDGEAFEASRTEQARLAGMREERPRHHAAFVAARNAEAETARVAQGEEQPREAVRIQPIIDDRAFPASAQVRYSEALARHYSPRDPYGSLAQASLAEAAAWQRERHELDRAIATEADPAKRDMLALRRDIEHADHMAQAYDRIAGMDRAIGGEAHDRAAIEDAARAQGFRDQAKEARQEWEARGIEEPSLYPALNDEMRTRQDEARALQERQQAAEREPQQPEPEPPGLEREEQPAPRSYEEETQAMRRMDFPGYAEQAHGYAVEWKGDTHDAARLRKGHETLHASQGDDGTWSYRNPQRPNDKGDIVRFEATRSGVTVGDARESLRPALAQEEAERGPLHDAPEVREQQRDGYERDGRKRDDERER
ncbi:AAA family ATPase [Nitrospirillum bahiense]|uniref:Ti-type conjugative transfer relaxase TraA n=1 Tax=Nitrospirillum amazonense TaxID=28077 RepID=A0A560FHQ9_9PROT|nr:AAA family ATPase [Nitrospirillum amazonense]TWB21116.1 Ti-type conjugative transfer relaxase TraA [Nitrospirillum amazonense]